MTSFTHDNIDDIVKEFVYPVPLTGEQNIQKLLGVLASENRRIDLDLESLYDDRFIGTATGRELEKMAFEVGVKRKTGETDDSLRQRVFGHYSAQSSDTTYDNFANATLNILEAEPGDITLTTPPQSNGVKSVDVSVDGAVLDDSPLTRTELASLLERSNAAGAAVNLVETGTFAFDGDDTSLKGWDDGTWSDTF